MDKRLLLVLLAFGCFLYWPTEATSCVIDEKDQSTRWIRMFSLTVGEQVIPDVTTYRELDGMLFFATQPKHTTPAIGVLGCEEQTKKILTKAEDFDPTAPFSSSTFRLGTPVKKDGALHLPYTHFNFPYPGWFSPEKHRHSFMDTGTTMEPMELIFDPTTWRAEARQIIPADCHHLVEHAEGDTKRLTMEDHLIEDVSGLFYVEGFVFFSASPIYGIPEIGVVQCSDLKRTRLLAARHITEAYPDGTDYFELKEVSKKEGAYEISYYYFPDVAAGDFSTFRTPPNLKVFNYRP